MADSIFDKVPELNYHEEAPVTDFSAFRKVVQSRRSVRVYEDRGIPEDVVRECLDLALLAPNSSNLQPWEFYWVRDPEKKKKLARLCFNQPAARTAPVLIVCVARTGQWRGVAREMKEILTRENAPKSAVAYYERLVPLAYGMMGPFGIFSPLKWLLFTILGLFRVVPRDPVSPWGMKVWAHKTVALACENLMLAFRAAGYDSCPMEGFDEWRIRSLLRLPLDAHVTMVVSAGVRKRGGVYGRRLRLPPSRFVFEV